MIHLFLILVHSLSFDAINLGSASALVEKLKNRDEFTRQVPANQTISSIQLAIDGIPDYEIYNFKDSGIGESWLIGTDRTGGPSSFANLFFFCSLIFLTYCSVQNRVERLPYKRVVSPLMMFQ